MRARTLFDKVFEKHIIRKLPTGQYQVLVSRHLIHEVTSAPAFDMLRERNLKVRFPHWNFGTADHIIPTKPDERQRPFKDGVADAMLTLTEQNCQEFGIRFFGLESEHQGIVHIIGPELGITMPGTVIACGDSHTSTHGAFGNLAFGIGTTEVACVLATGSLFMKRPKVRRIRVNGTLRRGVYAKDVILAIIRKLGVKGGIGYAYEYAGSAIDAMSMEERMTLCNMTIEGGARCGYVNPDEKTIEYLRGRKFAPSKDEFEARSQEWLSFRSDPDAKYDDEIDMRAEEIGSMVTWGINPGEAMGVNEIVPANANPESLAYMGLEAGKPIAGTQVDVVFIGSCTNGRIEDLYAAAEVVQKLYRLKVPQRVKAIVVPGSQAVLRQAEAEKLHHVFLDAGFEWRKPGCSMCLAMNPDKLTDRQVCASTSNRNFKGRQGSSGGRTILLSPAAAALAALIGEIADVEKAFA